VVGLFRQPVVRNGDAAHRVAAGPRLAPFPVTELIAVPGSPFPTKDAFSIDDSTGNKRPGCDAARVHGTRSHGPGTRADPREYSERLVKFVAVSRDGRTPTHDPRLLTAQQPSRHKQILAGNFEDQTCGSRQAGRCLLTGGLVAQADSGSIGAGSLRVSGLKGAALIVP
jgi:hypothetical protein